MTRAVLAAVVLALAATVGCSDDSGPEATRAASTTVQFTGADSQRFCALDTALRRDFGNVEAGAPADEKAATYQRALGALNEMEAAASDEIRATVHTLRTTLEATLPALAAVGFDPTRLDPQTFARASAPEVSAANERLGAYERQVCGRQ